MIIKKNEELKKYTTFKMGGTAVNFYIPEKEEELASIVTSLDDYKILGGGSNLLINDKANFENVIYMKKINNKIINRGNGEFFFGASVRLQEVIKTINKAGYGGIEYLYSVPGMLGGALYMNAGRGKKFNMQISDYLINVNILKDGQVTEMSKEQCGFNYRESIFQHNNYIILGATFKFEKMDKAKSEKLKKDRIELCNKVQDKNNFNFGSIFSQCSNRIMKIVSKISFRKNKGVYFSRKTANWLCNDGNGEFKEAIKLIRRVENIHKIFNKKTKLEVRIWE